MRESTTVHKSRNCIIELIHSDEDPIAWIVRHWKKKFFFNKLISSHWFYDRQQALEFVEQLKNSHSEH